MKLNLRNPLLPVAALFLVLSSACGGQPKPPAPATSAPATSAPATATPASNDKGKSDDKGAGESQNESESEATTAAPAESTPAPTAGGETRNIDDLSGSLDSLKSYRQRFTYSYDGKNDKGEPEKGAIEFVQEYIAATHDQHLIMRGMGLSAATPTPSSDDKTGAPTGGSNDAFEMFQVGGMMYMYNANSSGDQKCISFSADQKGANSQGPTFKPGDLVGGLSNATLIARGENVNGVLADHYSANEKDLTLGLYTSAKGDLWVAQEGGYVVKYVGEASGKTALIGKTAEGAFKWAYDIEDANKLDKITLPAECEKAKPAEDIPIPANATDKGNFGAMITFKSPDDPAKVTEFYQKELPAKGWKADENALEGILSFSKDNRTLTIMISKEDSGGCSVVITEAKK
jgi:hypothetical protein